MSSTKWKVSVEGQFLGHFPASSAEIAVEKAKKHTAKFYESLWANGATFEAIHGSKPAVFVSTVSA